MIESDSTIGSAAFSPSWTSHWGMRLDPFLGSLPRYIPLPPHEEAIARLSGLIESGQALGLLSGESGLGKSAVLGQVCRRLRMPGRRFGLVSHPADTSHLISALARSLGMPGDRKSLEAASRIHAWQQTHLVLIVDECRDLFRSAETADLKRLMNLGVGGRPRITLILATDDEPAVLDQSDFRDALPVRLKRLTRTCASDYLSAKLRDAGRVDDAFTPRALTRIHAASDGIPRTLDRIASLSLMAGAVQGLEMITPDLVDAIGQEISPSTRLKPWILSSR